MRQREPTKPLLHHILSLRHQRSQVKQITIWLPFSKASNPIDPPAASTRLLTPNAWCLDFKLTDIDIDSARFSAAVDQSATELTSSHCLVLQDSYDESKRNGDDEEDEKGLNRRARLRGYARII